MTQDIRILLVDDEESDRILIRRMLGRHFSTAIVTEAYCRTSFLHALDAREYDAILTDYKLGDIDGIEVIDLTRNRGLDTPIVMLTGTGTEEVAIQAMKRGVADYVIKNTQHLKRLPATVRHVLKSTQLEKERRAAEDWLRQSQKMEAVGTLASGIAHDINNTLTIIQGLAEVAKLKIPEDHEAQQAITGIINASAQASLVSKSLLTFSRKSVAERHLLNFAEIVADTCQSLEQTLPKSIRITTDLDASQPIWIDGDPSQLDQVTLNLAINSRDAMPNGGHLHISVVHQQTTDNEVSAGMATDENGLAILIVEDNGIGMPKETLHRVFEPFFTTKARGKGTGLGLSIVHGVISDHGGRILVDSDLGKGTRVTVAIPCRNPNDHESAAPDEQRARDGHGETILLIENERQVRALMTTSLEEAGYHIVQTGDGPEALAAFDEQFRCISLVVIDIELPAGDGPEYIRQMRATTPDLPVVFVGSLPAWTAAETTTNDHLLRKPYRMDELVRTVSESIAQHKVLLP